MSADQLDLLAGPGRHHGAASHDTEVAAASTDRGTMRERVLGVIRDAGPRGSTDEETSVRAHIARPHSAATRRAELQKLGFPIVDSGARRATSSGKSAVVWCWIVDEDGAP